ncbi:hypothetical protein M430DRAFT_34768 [Amorphotheca resinae ATCC 22711]|jgi:activating signal cointegrator complex subunit 1|uniref:A-kinase anchor protein 7-like phosphoesterase domain-containing protein n=1 Tax=Amorphotheca resinae ATCC 22711 TaxID=857342 RepID=A0A2T3B4F0_AMORE|nr:hypothetical protein M430DRAFT_34768 [Amorphotheca resinae ATCC 22711]PSS20510.1 hypothetical protein M430DRAFT_34768 [Amorphotheca resinae ATCC 22711]
MPPRAPAPRLTHFLCLPLLTTTSRPQLQSSLSAFRADLGGIPEAAVRPVGTLHLTLGVMSLLTAERVEQALALLRSLNLREMLEERIAGGGEAMAMARSGTPLRVTLRGLESMQNPDKTSVLYAAPVDGDLRLQRFCGRLKEAFSAAELLVPDTRPLLLHATIVNTVYVAGRGRSKGRLTIDAREVLERFEEHEWMSDVRLENVAICRMGARKLDDGDEEYVVEGQVELP